MASPLATAGLVLLLLAPLASAHPAPTQDAPPPPGGSADEAAIGMARVEAAQLTAGRLRSLADTAWGMGLKATAADLYRHVLEYSSDDSRARSRLGWKRKGDGWAREETPDFVDGASGSKAGSFAARRAKELAEPAEAHARLAALLEKAGRNEDARASYREALRLDPGNASAHRALGDVLLEGRWVPASVAAFRDLRKRLEETARLLRTGPSRAAPESERSKGEELLGVELARARSPRFFARTDGKPADAVALCDTAERSMDILDALLSTKAPEGEVISPYIILLGSEERYKEAVGRLSYATPEDRANALASIGTFLPDSTFVGFMFDKAWTQDLAAHKAGEAFLRHRYPAAYQSMWLREAFGVLAAALLLDSHETFCTEADSPDDLRDSPPRPSEWPRFLARQITRKADRPLREIAGFRMADLNYVDVAKACTLIQMWESTRAGSTALFLAAIDGGRSPDEAAVDAFGTGLDAQDEDWRAWIQALAGGK